MILETSAIVAMVKKEQGYADLVRATLGASKVRLSSASYVEAGIVVDGFRDPVASKRFDRLLPELGVQIEPVTERQAKLAREAYRDFGKGTGHPAQLNFGDCFSYALAKDLDEPLLYVGTDFSHTDVEPQTF